MGGKLVSHFQKRSPPRSPQNDQKKEERGNQLQGVQVKFDEQAIARQEKEATERRGALRLSEVEKVKDHPQAEPSERPNRKQRRLAFLKDRRKGKKRAGLTQAAPGGQPRSPPPQGPSRQVELR